MEVIISSISPNMLKLFCKQFEQFFSSQWLEGFQKMIERTIFSRYLVELFGVVNDGIDLFPVLYHMRVLE